MKFDHPRRFASKTRREANGCISWTGGVNNAGYGKFYVNRSVVLAHRWAYAAAKGPIPEGLQVDHLCRNRLCVNPEHLEPVSHRVNVLRGVGPTALNARKTHCPSGHPYSGANLGVNSDGGRFCRTCKRDQARAYRANNVKDIA